MAALECPARSAGAAPPDVTARCEHAWRTQRPANDWAGFLPNLREVLAVAREEAALLSAQSGLSRYDALLDLFEPGMNCPSSTASSAMCASGCRG